MTTVDAFRKLINTRGIHNKLGMPSSTVQSLRHRLKLGVHISTDKMIEILIKGGYKIKQEMLWDK